MTIKEIFDFLLQTYTPEGAAGIMGNIRAESNFIADNLQNSYNKKLGLSDAEYTRLVDAGIYKHFADDGAGYGLCQWTASSRKKRLYDFAKSRGASVGDCKTQLLHLIDDLPRYSALNDLLKTSHDIKKCATQFCCQYERPASLGNATTAAKTKLARARYAAEYLKTYGGDNTASVKLGSASLGSNGKTRGDKIGDQGREIRIVDWYRAKLGWYMIRPRNPTKAGMIADAMRVLCESRAYGYNQDYHDKGFDVLKAAGDLTINALKKRTEPVDTDCSGSVRIACACAGLIVPTFRTKNEVDVLGQTGFFEIHKEPKYTESADYLRRGDILVTRTSGHTVIVLTDGKKVGKDDKPANYKTTVNAAQMVDVKRENILRQVYAGTVVEYFGVKDGFCGIKLDGVKGYLPQAAFGVPLKNPAIVYCDPDLKNPAPFEPIPAGEYVEYYGISKSNPAACGIKYHDANTQTTIKGYINKEAL